VRFRYSDLKEAARRCGGRGRYANSIEGSGFGDTRGMYGSAQHSTGRKEELHNRKLIFFRAKRKCFVDKAPRHP
jgi:hypothetical protein